MVPCCGQFLDNQFLISQQCPVTSKCTAAGAEFVPTEGFDWAEGESQQAGLLLPRTAVYKLSRG